MSHALLFLVLFFCFAVPTFPQETAAEALNWDMTYATLLERSKVPPDSRISQWFNKTRKSPAEKIIEEFKNEPIVSAVLIERPSLGLGESGMTSNLFVRTRKAAYFWELNVPAYLTGPTGGVSKTPLSMKQFDRMFRDLSRLEQATPVPAKENGSGWEGYWGVLSTYKKGSTRQILLTVEDLYELKYDPPTPGRVALVVDMAVSSIPQTSALIFTSCGKRLTKTKIVELFGAPSACDTVFNFGTGKAINNAYTCFPRNIRASFDALDEVTLMIFGDLGSRYQMSRILPTGSWLGFSRNRRSDRKAFEIPTGSYSEYLFEDDCVKIRTTVSTAQTNYTPGFYAVTWK